MKILRLSFVITILLFTARINAQPWQWETTNGPPGRNLFNVTTQKNEVFSTQQSGDVFRSINKGQSWIKCTAPPGAALDIKRCGTNIIAGNYISSDNGVSWQTVQNVSMNSSFERLLVEGSDMYGVTTNHLVYKSNNCGVNWQNITYNIYGYWNNGDMIKVDSSLFVAVCAKGIYHKKLSDTVWTLRNNGLQTGVISLFAKGSVLYAGT